MLISRKDFGARVRAAKGAKRPELSRVQLRKTMMAVTAIDGERTITGTWSTEAEDADGDTIYQPGWLLDTFATNPVVCAQHVTSQPPIGRCVQIGLVGGKLKGTIEFVPREVPQVGELAESYFQLYKRGFMNAFSVGFIPIEFDTRRSNADGIDFKKQRLIELSCVTCPANAQALIDPSSRW